MSNRFLFTLKIWEEIHPMIPRVGGTTCCMNNITQVFERCRVRLKFIEISVMVRTLLGFMVELNKEKFAIFCNVITTKDC